MIIDLFPFIVCKKVSGTQTKCSGSSRTAVYRTCMPSPRPSFWWNKSSPVSYLQTVLVSSFNKFFTVIRKMCCLRADLQVTKTIIQFVSIDVVYYLFFRKGLSQILFNKIPMLQESFAIHCNSFISFPRNTPKPHRASEGWVLKKLSSFLCEVSMVITQPPTDRFYRGTVGVFTDHKSILP